MPIRPGTEAANLLESVWRPEMALAATEEMVVAKNFDDGNDGVEKIANTLYIRKIAAIPAQTLGATGTGQSLTYSTNTEERVAVTPTFAYNGVEIVRNTLTRLIADAQLRKGYRDQMAAGLATKIDVDAAALAASLTQVVGGAGEVVSKGLMLDGLTRLATNSKNKWKKGKTKAYFCFHPSQIKHVLDIPEITAANVRGDAQNPNVTGFVWDAWGLMLDESGNVYQAGGVTHNLLHIRDSHILGYNQKPDFLSPQEFELTIRLIAYTEYGVGEVWDEYAVDVQTAA